MLVKDVPLRPPISISHKSPIGQAAELLSKHKMRSIPVIDTDGDLVGDLHEGDVIRGQVQAKAGPVDDSDPSPTPSVASLMKQCAGIVDLDQSIADASVLIDRLKLPYLYVVRGRRLVGILRQSDAMTVLQAGRDEELRLQVRHRLTARLRDRGRFLDVLASHETIFIGGVLSSQDVLQAARALAVDVPGVEHVVDDVIILSV